ncbi:hypothetical protein [Inediibacterium massiliense]|uniref:hypothetical protein n=1 Tax=Inediibacterium massiliense TaxID=1658111 RepID=UPI0006B42B25|nr:hypothetical protein [Inediibacterium massiliense]
MSNLYYCKECRKIEKNDLKCGCCSSENMMPLKVGAPVNVIGTKQKGRVLKMQEDQVSLLIVNELNQKMIKDHLYNELQKIL